MAEFPGTFDASGIDPNATDFPVLPPADYRVMIVKSEMKPTKDGTGQFLSLEMEIMDGAEKGKRLFQNLNLVNNGEKKEQTEAIAQKALAQICHATGVIQCSNSDQLHMKPMIATVYVKPAKGQYAESNGVRKYSAVTGAAAASTFVRPGTAAAPAAAAAQPAAVAAQAAPAAAPAPAAPANAFARPAGATPPWGAKKVAA